MERRSIYSPATRKAVKRGATAGFAIGLFVVCAFAMLAVAIGGLLAALVTLVF